MLACVGLQELGKQIDIEDEKRVVGIIDRHRK